MKILTKQIKELEAQKMELYRRAGEISFKIRELKEKRRKVCSHPSYKIVDQSWMEDGRMSFPVRWKEKVCTRCGKVLSTSSQVTKWTKFK
jgi:hypothetical protein